MVQVEALLEFEKGRVAMVPSNFLGEEVLGPDQKER